MALDTSTPDYFQLSYINFVDQGYVKNDGFSRIGAFDRDDGIGYVDELLFRPEEGIINGTINSVEIDFEITNTLLSTAQLQVHLRVQDQGAWTDTPTTEPVFITFLNETWPASLGFIGGIDNDSTGVHTILSTAAMVQYFQDLIDGEEPNDGMLLTMNTSFFDFRMRIANIEVRVDFSPLALTYVLL